MVIKGLRNFPHQTKQLHLEHSLTLIKFYATFIYFANKQKFILKIVTSHWLLLLSLLMLLLLIVDQAAEIQKHFSLFTNHLKLNAMSFQTKNWIFKLLFFYSFQMKKKHTHIHLGIFPPNFTFPIHIWRWSR